jgi:serine/threonine protein kinase
MPELVIKTELSVGDGSSAAQRAKAIWRELQAATSDTHDILGWLGYDRLNNHVYLGRHRSSGALHGFQLVLLDPFPSGEDRFRARQLDVFDPSLIELGGTCSSCGKKLTGWEVECVSCGLPPGVPAGAGVPERGNLLLAAARRVTAGRYEVLGPFPRAPGLAAAYFGRELTTGSIVVFWLREVGTDAARQTTYAQTQTIYTQSQTTYALGPVHTVTPASASPHSGEVGPLEDAAGLATGERAGRKVCPHCKTVYPPEANFCVRDQRELVLEGQDEPMIGMIIGGRYKVLRRLGAGGMGRVYLAEHLGFGRQDAVKIMAPGLAADADAVRRFRREAENASRVKHRNCATIYDFGDTGTASYYIAMEFIEGATLAGILADHGTMPLERVLDITLQICDALQAAHALQPPVVHRDLKPDNVMIAAEEGCDVVKVVDFGIAKAVQGQSLSATGIVIGTPAYMSPEQLFGKPVDTRGDIYSVGCILYELCTGRRAYPGDSPEEIAFKKTQGAPPRPSEVRPELPSELDAVVVKALARTPESRHATITEFRDALRRIQATASTAPLRRGGPPRPPWRTHYRAYLVGGLVGLSILAYAGTAVVRMRDRAETAEASRAVARAAAEAARAESVSVASRADSARAVQRAGEVASSLAAEPKKRKATAERAAQRERERQASVPTWYIPEFGAKITGIEFVEGEHPWPNSLPRQPASRFNGDSARYVYVQLSFTPTHTGTAYIGCNYYRPDGGSVGELEDWVPAKLTDTREHKITSYWGSNEPGRAFFPGTWKVRCRDRKGSLLATGQFSIY